jgi:hypothetical protein
MTVRTGLAIAVVCAGSHVASARAQGRSLPEDPCDVLTPAQMSTASGLDVTSATRVESIAEIVRARNGERPSGAGTICRYDTSSPFGSIEVEIRADRRAEAYASLRAAAFAKGPASAVALDGIGADAWLVGGASLHVLVHDADYFTVTTQNYRPESRDVLVRIARRMVAELTSPAPGRN